MDKEILEILKAIQLDIQEVKATQEKHTKALVKVIDEVARLREDVTDLKEDMKESKADLRLVKIATVEHSNEIEKLKIAK